MGLLIINYIRQNEFMNFDNSSNPVIKVYDEEGNVKETRPYQKQVFAKTQSWVRPRFTDGKFTLSLPYKTKEDREKLNELVARCNLLYPRGHHKEEQPILEANPRNIRDAFFTHDEFMLYFDSGQATIDDETPIGYLQSMWIKADDRFKIYGEDDEYDPLMSGKVYYSVSRAGAQIEDDETRSVDETIEATERLSKLDFESKKKIARAMGLKIVNPDPKILRNLLYRKITTDKDRITEGFRGKRNIDVFMQLTNAPKKELSVRDIITQARDNNIILRKSGNKYYYGDILLGNNLEKVMEYLDENDEVFSEIVSMVEGK